MLFKFSVISGAVILTALAGCETVHTTGANPVPIPPVVGTTPATQPSEVVAHIADIQIPRSEVDDLLYKTYGLRIVADLAELDVAKRYLKLSNTTLTPEDVKREHDMIMAGICGDAPQADWPGLFHQFLEREHMTEAEFDVRAVQTKACLRKVIEPMVRGKFTEAQLQLGFEQLYGAKRRVAKITVANPRDAGLALQMLKTMPFETVARRISTDESTKVHGGEMPAFSSTVSKNAVPEVINKTAFSLEVGQVSGILVGADNQYHIIKVLEVLQPKIVKFQDVKDSVRQEMEDTYIEANISETRKQIKDQVSKALRIDDPVIMQEWERERAPAGDRDTALQKMNSDRARAATAPAATMPTP